MDDLTKAIFTVSEAAAELGVTERHVRKLIDTERLPAMRLGSLWVIRRADVTSFRRIPTGRPVNVKADTSDPMSFANFLFHPSLHRDATKALRDFLLEKPLFRLDEYKQLTLRRLVAHLDQVGGLHLEDLAERAWERWQKYKADYCRKKRISSEDFDKRANAKRIVNLAHVYRGDEPRLL